jgi:hypothetical protein
MSESECHEDPHTQSLSPIGFSRAISDHTTLKRFAISMLGEPIGDFLAGVSYSLSSKYDIGGRIKLSQRAREMSSLLEGMRKDHLVGALVTGLHIELLYVDIGPDAYQEIVDLGLNEFDAS